MFVFLKEEEDINGHHNYSYLFYIMQDIHQI